MNFKQPLPSFRWPPKSAYFWWWFNDFLDAGLRQHDGYKVNGPLAVIFWAKSSSRHGVFLNSGLSTLFKSVRGDGREPGNYFFQ